jgi:hypothetical protein
MPLASAARCRRVARRYDEHPKARPLPREGSACRVGRRRNRRHSLGRRFPVSQDSPALLYHYATSRRHARATGRQKIRDRDTLPTSAGEQSLTLGRGWTPPLRGHSWLSHRQMRGDEDAAPFASRTSRWVADRFYHAMASVRLIQDQERALRPPPPASTHHRLALPLPLPPAGAKASLPSGPPQGPRGIRQVEHVHGTCARTACQGRTTTTQRNFARPAQGW